MPFLSVKNLKKSFDTNLVLDNISFDIEEGEFLSLLGPSGCGKTTILRCIAGFIGIDSGTIEVDKKILNDIPIHKRNIGMVFQSYALFPHMTVEQNVAYGLEQRHMSKDEITKAVDDILDLVKLTEFRKRKPGKLSGGQQQRVALARALVIKPDLLLLDESLSALDKNLRVEMQVELKEIQKKSGITAIFVTHDQEEALTLSDRVAVMNKGKIIQMDSPEVIYEKPADVFVAGFLGKANYFEGEIIEKDGNAYTHKLTNGETLCYQAEGDYRIGDKLTVTVRPEKINISKDKPEGISTKGIIEFVTYAGDITNYRIELLGQIIEVQEQNHVRSSRFSKNQEVYVSWDKANTLMLT